MNRRQQLGGCTIIIICDAVVIIETTFNELSPDTCTCRGNACCGNRRQEGTHVHVGTGIHMYMYYMLFM